MKIKVPEVISPFSHEPGAKFILPHTSLVFQIFPAKISIFDGSAPGEELLHEFFLNMAGPLEQFTIQQSFAKSSLTVWGKKDKKFFRYKIEFKADKRSVLLTLLSNPYPNLELRGEEIFKLNLKEPVELMKHSLTARNLQPEKLTFGIHKSQDLFLMKRRLDLQEIVPWWYTLAQFVPKLDELPDEKLAAYKLLQEFEIATREQKNDLVGKILQDIFLACFSHDLVPSLCDKSFQGILAPEIIANTSSSPLVFLRQLFDQIKSLFIQFSDDSISILPALPPEFPVGKLIDVNIAGLKVNLEWTKKRIRRVELFNLSSVTKELSLNFRHIKFCRLQTGSFKSACKFYNADNLILPANSYFLFDNFLF